MLSIIADKGMAEKVEFNPNTEDRKRNIFE